MNGIIHKVLTAQEIGQLMRNLNHRNGIPFLKRLTGERVREWEIDLQTKDLAYSTDGTSCVGESLTA